MLFKFSNGLGLITADSIGFWNSGANVVADINVIVEE